MDKNRIVDRGLVATGIACCVVGAGLAVAKHLHPLASEYAAGVGRALANGGILAVAGLGFVALGRSRAGGRAEGQDLLLEQVAADLVQLRARLDAQSGGLAPANRTTAVDDDRLFRLAAAIDQLGARLDARLKAQHGELAAELLRLRTEWTAHASPAAEDRSAPGRQEDDQDPWLSTPEPEIELETGYEPGEDDFEVVVELEDEDDDSPGLGILDDIEEARHAAEPRPGPALPEATLEAKLAALKDLMGDPAVRAALDATRRAG
ncbi:MAG: hypothetical protein RL112_2227 [Planctomycetota bacterium]